MEAEIVQVIDESDEELGTMSRMYFSEDPMYVTLIIKWFMYAGDGIMGLRGIFFYSL